MTVFKTFFKVGKKYIGPIIMYTVIFLIIVILIGKANQDNTTANYTASKVKVAVFDHDNSDLSKGMVAFLNTNHNPVEMEEELDTIRDMLYQRRVEYVITIPEGFGAGILNEEKEQQLEVYKLPGSASAQFMDLSINSFLSICSGYLSAGFAPDEAYKHTAETMEKESRIDFYKKEATQSFSPVHNFYVYIPYALFSVIILGIGPILFVFNNSQIKIRMNCSKLPGLRKNVSLMTASGIYTVMITLLYFVFSVFLYKGDILNQEGLLRLLNMVIYAFVSLSFAFLFSMLTTKQHMLNIFSNAFGLGSCFLCGIFVPREWLSDVVVEFGKFFPAYWYVNVEEALIHFNGEIISDIIMGYLVQILYGIAVFVIALVYAQYRKNK